VKSVVRAQVDFCFFESSFFRYLSTTLDPHTSQHSSYLSTPHYLNHSVLIESRIDAHNYLTHSFHHQFRSLFLDGGERGGHTISHHFPFRTLDESRLELLLWDRDLGIKKRKRGS